MVREKLVNQVQATVAGARACTVGSCRPLTLQTSPSSSQQATCYAGSFERCVVNLIKSVQVLKGGGTLDTGEKQTQIEALSVTDLQGPPLERTQMDKLRDLKSLAQQYARDQGSCDDIRISYLEFVESEAEDNLTLARMIAG
jgi:hypothetical protein